MFCKVCGAECAEQNEICPHCGSALRNCKFCGGEIAPGYQYCPACKQSIFARPPRDSGIGASAMPREGYSGAEAAAPRAAAVVAGHNPPEGETDASSHPARRESRSALEEFPETTGEFLGEKENKAEMREAAVLPASAPPGDGIAAAEGDAVSAGDLSAARPARSGVHRNKKLESAAQGAMAFAVITAIFCLPFGLVALYHAAQVKQLVFLRCERMAGAELSLARAYSAMGVFVAVLFWGAVVYGMSLWGRETVDFVLSSLRLAA